MTAEQKKLASKHGNPAEFASACYEAVPAFISMDEAAAAIRKYNAQWEGAGMKELLNQPVLFGLRAQGHLPIIEKMLAEGASWEEIGKVIHWEPATAKDFYEREERP